jgi:hypothetical protein
MIEIDYFLLQFFCIWHSLGVNFASGDAGDAGEFRRSQQLLNDAFANQTCIRELYTVNSTDKSADQWIPAQLRSLRQTDNLFVFN